MSLPCCCASPAHAAGTTHAHSHAHKHTMSTCRTMRSTAAAALYLKLRQRGKPHGWKHTRMNTGTRWHGHYLATASALLPPACAAGVRREKNVAHKMHCSRGHQERHRAMAARCGGGTARYIPKRASRRQVDTRLTNRARPSLPAAAVGPLRGAGCEGSRTAALAGGHSRTRARRSFHALPACPHH